MRKALYSKQGAQLRAWLKQGRLDGGLTMRDLAKKLDIPFQAVGKIENGERRLDVVEYVNYCNTLGIDPHEGIDVVRKR